MRGCGDQQIHHPGARLTPHLYDASGEAPVTVRDSIVDR
jgi:hypothetical protein